MTKKQKYWLDRLNCHEVWSLDTSSVYDDAVVDNNGCSTYLDENAVIIYDASGNIKVNFSPDWFFKRKKACDKLNAYLETKRILENNEVCYDKKRYRSSL